MAATKASRRRRQCLMLKEGRRELPLLPLYSCPASDVLRSLIQSEVMGAESGRGEPSGTADEF